MKMIGFLRMNLLAAIMLVVCTVSSFAKDIPKWVVSWGASPMAMTVTHPMPDSRVVNTVRLSLGGQAVRVTLTNEFGTTPLRLEGIRLTVPGTSGGERPLTFAGQAAVLIPAGGTSTSDAVPLPVSGLTNVTISFYIPAQEIATSTCHEAAIATNYFFHGDSGDLAHIANGEAYHSWCFLKDVQVQQSQKSFAIVALGDSITDGAHATVDANHRWPDFLAERLKANKSTQHVAVINQGIGGNRILYNGHGPSASSRVDRDVIGQAGVGYLILLEGINDIDQTINPKSAEAALTVEQMTSAVTQIVGRAHAHHIVVYGATVTPNGGIKTVTPHVNELRAAYNKWIRTSTILDGFIDFDRALSDPDKPNELLPLYDCGDHLHPSDAGYKAMADAIDLKLFQTRVRY